MPRWTYSLARRFDELMALFPAWERAFQHAPPPRCPTHAPAWMYGLWFQQSGVREVRVVAVWEEEELALVFPYCCVSAGRRTVVQGLIEINPVFSPRPSADAYSFLLDVLHAQHPHAEVVLQQVDTLLPPVAHLEAAAQAHGWAIDREKTHENVIVDLSEGWPAYQAALSSNTREGLRKARARLNREAQQVDYHCFASVEDVRAALDRCLTVDSQSWKYGRGGAMCVSDKEDVQFKCAMERFAEQGQARVFLLDVNQQPAAFILATVLDGTAYFSIWSFAEPFRHYMPGKALMAFALQSLADEGVREVDFWGRHDRFKASWSPVVQPRYRVRMAPPPRRVQRVAGAFQQVGRRVLAPLRYLMRGAPERYRLRVDQPSPFDVAVRQPVERFLQVRRARPRMQQTLIADHHRQADAAILVRRATARDRVCLPLPPAGPEAADWVFEAEGMLVGGLLVEPHPGPSSVHLHGVTFRTPSAALRRRCLRAFFHANASITRIHEPTLRRHEHGAHCVADLLAPATEQEQR